MRSVLIDSVVIIGAFYRNDQWHVKATPIIRHIDDGKSQAIITDFILAEVINFLHQKAGHFAAIETLEALESSENITFVRITDSQFSAGKAFVCKISAIVLCGCTDCCVYEGSWYNRDVLVRLGF